MSSTNIVDSCSDGDLRGYVKAVKLEPGFVGRPMSQKEFYKNDVLLSKGNSEENRIFSVPYTGQGGRGILGQEQSQVDDSGLCSISPICPAPLCRQFWKAGNYEGLSSKPTHKNGTSYLHIHPKFLHSNATSHKWAFGAIAELLDNAIDEIQNGATFVVVDKTINPRDGNFALLIQDDGGGMDPEAIRRCMSFGFSDKKSKSAIGQYGNGFKTSSMRLGADVVVFSCSMKRKRTRSIGLLSYSFLTQTGLDRIVVPMIAYEFNSSTGTWNSLYSEQNLKSNLSLLLQWSPYSSEEDLLRQFVDIGDHGTKIIIYNLWLTDEGKTELDFNTDPEDIRVCIDANTVEKGGGRVSVSDSHLANRLRFSLRAYLSILYLRVPENFCIVLRGSIVAYHNIANELKYRQCIMYRPQTGGVSEGEVITTIGFLKEAPLVNHHGFNVYHKNRLILPFWHVVSYSDSRGRGVVGVLEANFIQPTHNKQDFEKTPLFQKLEARLKEMTWEYWDYHCGLVGYLPKKKAQAPKTPRDLPESHEKRGTYQSVFMSKNPSGAIGTEVSRQDNLPRTFHHNYQQVPVVPLKRKERNHPIELENVKQKVRNTNMTNARCSQTAMPVGAAGSFLGGEEAVSLIQENTKLRAQCLEHEKRVEELNMKVIIVRKQLKEKQKEYGRLLLDLKLLEKSIKLEIKL